MKTYKTESGRSMIEMLGVLAIIGVLSVGGIAGYSKAMMKYRTNKTIEQISMIVTNIRTLFGSQKSYSALGAVGTSASSDNNSSLIAKARLFPDELLNGTTGVLATPNPFGGTIDLVRSNRSITGVTKDDDSDKKAFLLSYSDIPEEACMDLITQDWGSASGSGLIVAGIVPTKKNGSSEAFSATQYIGLTQGCKSEDSGGTYDKYVCGGQGPMTAAEAADACSGDKNTLYLKFY